MSKPGKVREQQEIYDVPERYEIIGGIRYDLKPSPKLDHQILVTKLWQHLNFSCHPNGIVVVSPMDVHLDEANIVQPDIIFISNDSLGIIRGKEIHGVPDLLIEILSPLTGARDKTLKKHLYEKFGVKEYWIVDPVIKTVDRFVLKDQLLHLKATYTEEDLLTSDVFACISIDLQAVFAELKRFEDN
ncbi:Uma2 family endonuclease [Paenibacillus alkalitolerans]|uniref:Uma2 family endonuclease n=1 Tax=Paenibacillus alkalitolerans TaxID=2799335 RepID=UPI0018F49E93|nr:Uma2 family endonuclease [Paenibacillus alkalitolerans]